MKKLLSIALLLSLSTTAFAQVESASIPLTGGTIAASGSLKISLVSLYPSAPYNVTCQIQNPLYQTDQVVIAPQYSETGVKVKYSLNGKYFSQLVSLNKQQNTFVATGIQNISTTSNLAIANLDTDPKATVTVSQCVAVPDIKITQAK